jgi:hypothetical protein
MLKDFYLRRHLRYSIFETLEQVLKNWAITLIAINHVAVESMTEEDHTAFENREKAVFLFKVEQCLDLGAASERLDAMLLEAGEKAYEEKVERDLLQIERAEEFAEQFME